MMDTIAATTIAPLQHTLDSRVCCRGAIVVTVWNLFPNPTDHQHTSKSAGWLATPMTLQKVRDSNHF